MDKYSSSELSNLVMILKMFNDRPNHLANFLLENKALTKDFLKKISDSQKLDNIKKVDNGPYTEEIFFKNLEEMKKYYNELLHEIKSRTTSEKLQEIDFKISKAVSEENYEEAVRLRDLKRKLKK